MRNATVSIADEVEAAIAAGSTEKCAQTTKQVAALFLESAGRFSREQIELFGDIFERLINTIELRALAEAGARIALAELSTQLAGVPQAPMSVVRRLANHDEISIAGPMLAESSRLGPAELVEIAQQRSERHLLAIAGRWWVQEMVADALLARRFPSVSRRLMDNPGARVSAAGFAMIVSQAIGDPELAVATGIRADLPASLRAQLVQHATEAVRDRLLARAPPHLVEEIRAAIATAAAGVDREMSRSRDFAGARLLLARLKKEGGLSEAVLVRLARQKKYEETIVVLAELSRASVEVVRPLMQSLRSDGILVPCKVAGLSWETVCAVLDCRFSTGVTAPDELAKLRRHFGELTRAEAQRALRLWMARANPAAPNVN
ncbi:MAG: DUF2336 domain-containing protein [Bradyrhizobium sp.]|uniref:DUF2336 domain-containing protein n=1 Tax=Bradyrhizobium sp. TaxID=376 RepID=UPI001DC8B7E6|nr:DUF2336 domain-containing protein [Bradyrhizobium sp.]MBV9560471.1 DUF2336 domain-containing protein [Bradyrhizobium sp.]